MNIQFDYLNFPGGVAQYVARKGQKLDGIAAYAVACPLCDKIVVVTLYEVQRRNLQLAAGFNMLLSEWLLEHVLDQCPATKPLHELPIAEQVVVVKENGDGDE